VSALLLEPAEQVRVTCHGVTGGADTEADPPVEDRFVMPFPAPAGRRALGAATS
jgi:hypothetical protein